MPIEALGSWWDLGGLAVTAEAIADWPAGAPRRPIREGHRLGTSASFVGEMKRKTKPFARFLLVPPVRSPTPPPSPIANNNDSPITLPNDVISGVYYLLNFARKHQTRKQQRRRRRLRWKHQLFFRFRLKTNLHLHWDCAHEQITRPIDCWRTVPWKIRDVGCNADRDGRLVSGAGSRYESYDGQSIWISFHINITRGSSWKPKKTSLWFIHNVLPCYLTIKKKTIYPDAVSSC